MNLCTFRKLNTVITITNQKTHVLRSLFYCRYFFFFLRFIYFFLSVCLRNFLMCPFTFYKTNNGISLRLHLTSCDRQGAYLSGPFCYSLTETEALCNLSLSSLVTKRSKWLLNKDWMGAQSHAGKSMDKRMKVFLMLLQYMSHKIILDLFQLFVILNRPKIRALWAITSVVGQIFVQMFGQYTARAICGNFWIQLKQINKQKKNTWNSNIRLHVYDQEES